MKRLLIATSILVALVGIYAVYLMMLAGEFRDIRPSFSGDCRIVAVPGAEDIVITRDGRAAFISSHDRLAELAGDTWRGAIYLYDLTRDDPTPINLTPDAAANFRPHGIGLWEQDGRTSLFVVTHPGANLFGDVEEDGPKHTVEVFDVVDRELHHRRSVVDAELLITPNDVGPVGHDAFYVTNDHGTGDRLWRKVHSYLRIAKAHILYFDGAALRRLPGEYHYANGIIATPDSARIYLAAVTDRRIHVFDRDADTGDLEFVRVVDVDTGLDNLNLDEHGDIWVGAHPKLLTLVSWMKGNEAYSPSQVLRVDVDNDFAVEEVMMSDGKDLSASTVAARWGNRLLVGGLDSRGFLDCVLPATP